MPEQVVNLSKIPRNKRGKVWLAASGKTMTGIAQEVGLSLSYISRVLRGEMPSPENVAKLLKAGVPGEIFYGAEE